MRDELHRKPYRDPGCHLQDYRRQCDGNCHLEGHEYSCQIWQQGQYSQGNTQLCHGDVLDQICNPGKRSGLREDCLFDQAILFST